MSRVSPLFERAFIGSLAWRRATSTVALIGAALSVGGLIGASGSTTTSMIVGAIALLTVLVLRQDQLAVTLMVTVHIYVDWYNGLSIVAQGLACVLLCVFFLARSPRYPWAEPRLLWLWLLLLGLAIFPAMRGATTTYDAAYYYPNIFVGAFIALWLGVVIARDYRSLCTLFEMLALLGALLAIVTLVEAKTGVVLFATSRLASFLSQVSNFQLANSTAHRSEGYFVNPDWNGAFFGLMLFLPLGLLTAGTSLLRKFLYLGELFLMLIALLSTYSTGAWLGACVGMLAFMLFVGRHSYRILLLLLMLSLTCVMFMFFPTEVNLLLRHSTSPAEISLRSGAWQTAIRIIRAFPLTGIGLGLTNYMIRAEPYRVAAQYTRLAHPHDSYLELGAMAGLPVLLVFVSLLCSALWQAWRNWLRQNTTRRCLLAGGLAAIIALSVNSLSINGWTLPPLAEIGWLILGAISSPLFVRNTTAIGREERL